MSNASSVINELNSVIGGFTSSVDNKIETIDAQAEQTKRTANTALQKIHTFKEQMIADEQMQAAHENILRLDQVIREKFESNIKMFPLVVMLILFELDSQLIDSLTTLSFQPPYTGV